jgi:RuvB-like protein 1
LDDIIKILAIRATTENIRISKDALAFLGKIGNETSLRYIIKYEVKFKFYFKIFL